MTLRYRFDLSAGGPIHAVAVTAMETLCGMPLDHVNPHECTKWGFDRNPCTKCKTEIRRRLGLAPGGD